MRLANRKFEGTPPQAVLVMSAQNPDKLQSQREKKNAARTGVQLCFFRQSRSAKICSDLRQLRT